MPDNDGTTFRAESLFQVDPSIPGQSLMYELERFADMSLDAAAVLIDTPLNDYQCAQLMDAMGQVSGYVLVELGEFQDKDDDEMLALLSDRLTTCDLINVEYQGVWVFGKTLALYVRGKLDEPQ